MILTGLINTLDDHCRQLEILSQHEFRLGILGHTHRARLFSLAPGLGSNSVVRLDELHQVGKCFDLAEYPCSVANAGSIGQPRDKLCSNPANPEWMLVELDQHGSAAITYMPFLYDCDSHSDLSRSSLIFLSEKAYFLFLILVTLPDWPHFDLDQIDAVTHVLTSGKVNT